MRIGNSQPGADQLLFDRAVFSLQNGKLAQAERDFRALLRKQPEHPGALNLLGVLLTRLGRFAEAEPYIRQATSVTAGSDATFYNYGIVLKNLDRPLEALDAFSRALALNADVAETWNNRGTVLSGLGRHDEAISDFIKATSLKPGYADAFCNKGKPLIQTRRYAEALAAYAMALKLNPGLAEAWQGEGDVLAALGRHQEAIAAFGKATALKPDYAEAYANAAASLVQMERHDEALAAFDTALRLRPDLAEAWKGRGTLLAMLRRYDEAIVAFEAALKADPQIAYVPGDLLHARAQICDWQGLGEGWSSVIRALQQEARVSTPFALLAGPASAADQLRCSRIYASDRIPPGATQLWRGERTSHDRIRIAYLSADFREHAVSQVAAGMFERHDHARFETCAISYGADDGSAMRARLSGAFDRFIDVRQKSDPEIASLIRELEIDIAIDLTGYTAGMRANVLAQRPAPLQVNYLGYPGTMGADFIDYIVADRFLIPPELQSCYAEKIAYLNCYQAGDPRRVIAEPGPTRADCGLPQDGFVFCSFNNPAKITPDMFEVWMRLLQCVENSVLWLFAKNAAVIENLRQRAAMAGIAAERIVFAAFAPTDVYLARLRLADLFLDSFPYNAGATCNDALWAGLPVLTCAGETYVSRMAGSLLTAVGTPELITGSAAEYEATALDLARNRERLAALRGRLMRQRLSFPLFDTDAFTRQIETAYQTMWERHRQGAPPQTFTVGAT